MGKFKHMKYEQLNDNEKITLLQKEYSQNKNSFNDIATKYNTYANKLRRDAMRFNIVIRSKSEAQKNVLSTGKVKHPTKGKQRPDSVKNKIGNSVMKSWEQMDQNQLNERKLLAKKNWEKLDDEEKKHRLRQANLAVRLVLS